MYRDFQKNANHLKRAEELLTVNQKGAALEKIKEGLANRYLLKNDPKTLDEMFTKFIELCVEQRKGKALKEGLYHIRRTMNENNIHVIGKGVRRLLELCESKVEVAQADAEKINLEYIEDLEATETPESILLSVVSGEQSKDRTDRVVVTPWLKFLWETYRSLLDFLRHSSYLEELYHLVTIKAIDFCRDYQRKTEIRRLCEILRINLQNLIKGQGHQAYYVNINDPEILQRFLESRFYQLDAVVQMELWQEAFRSIEDINYLIRHSKRPVKPQTMANYYEKMTRIMFTAKNQLFIAASWNRYYALIKNRTDEFSAEQLCEVANNVLLSTLAVPIIKPSTRVMSAEAEENKRRTQSLTSLLFLTCPPTRDSLINDLVTGGTLNHVRPELRPIYHFLEEKFHPLTICKIVAPIIENEIVSNEKESKYASLLCNVILTRLIQQLSQVYNTVKLDFVLRLAQFPKACNMTPVQIERFIMNGARRGEFRLKIDYQSRSVHFDTDLYEPSNSSSSGAQLQVLPSELVRTQLTSLSVCLANAQRVVCPDYVEQLKKSKEATIVQSMLNIAEEHNYTLSRKVFIEKKNLELENLHKRREKEEKKERDIRAQREQENERKRLEEERLQRAEERLKKEREAIQREEAKRLAEDIKKKAGIDVSNEDLESLDTDKLMKMQLAELEKERERAKARLKTISRKIDHTQRAYRKEEIPLLEKDYERQKAEDKVNHEIEQKEKIRIHREIYEQSLHHKARMQRMFEDFKAKKGVIEQQNMERLSKLRAEAKANLEEAKQARIENYHRLKKEQEKREQEELERKRKQEEEEAKRREQQLREQKEAEEKAKTSTYVPPSRRNQAAGGSPAPGPVSSAFSARSGTSPSQPASTGVWRSSRVASASASPGASSSVYASSGSGSSVNVRQPSEQPSASKPGVWRPRHLRESGN
ncbi:eukaryotic translation initiation factor 3 subunit A [Mycoemilia scoparia]|uniref:Eukaryotic translation initiation factor 3 subunit A n=1 Tax=Mycoemilia scoparia TaxID=417184 RepID=A0A9W8A6D3_9FUNG|nr:eukaryotic translation initiation factor 3 subunit A [Mycoemilia scoparia]